MTSRRWIWAVKAGTVVLWTVGLAIIASNGFRRDVEGKPFGSDHVAFYSAARLIDEGRTEVLYDYGALGELQGKIIGVHSGFVEAYRNPPFYALFYLPTSRLPYVVSYWIWTLVSVVMLGLGIRWLGAERPMHALILALSFLPVIETFNFGQNSLLSFGLFALSFRFLDRGQKFAAGLAAGMLLYKPQLLLGLGIWWMFGIRDYWKALLGVAAMAAFWTFVSVLVVPRETELFLNNLPRIADYEMFMFYNLQNPRGFGRLVAFDDKAFGNIFGLMCSTIGVAFFVLFQRQHRGNPPLMFAAAVFLTLWASPHTMIYEWSLALVPAILLWEQVPQKRETWLRIFTISWIALFITVPVSRFFCEWTKPRTPGDPRQGWAIQIAVPVMAMMAIWAMRAVRTVSDRRA